MSVYVYYGVKETFDVEIDDFDQPYFVSTGEPAANVVDYYGAFYAYQRLVHYPDGQAVDFFERAYHDDCVIISFPIGLEMYSFMLGDVAEFEEAPPHPSTRFQEMSTKDLH